ncbi:MAG TPA: sortase [Candidatus Saccharimonadales bacterium]|nr:sortase [Candidatus Saccharimonadales bacterium]
MNPKDPVGFSAIPSYEPPEPASINNDINDKNQAAELIRQKIEQIYKDEPPAKAESTEAEETPTAARSKHQMFMHKLTTGGKSLAEIQTAWHNYYLNLPDDEKHQVWQEFYVEHGQHSNYARHTQQPKVEAKEHPPAIRAHPRRHGRKTPTVSQLRAKIIKKVNERGPIKSNQHLQSLMFGVGMGSIVVLLLLFSFFNERIIAPFISPSRKVSSAPIIIDQSTLAVSGSPEIIIPKINVQIPVIYNEPSVDEKAVQKALEGGVLHYGTTVNPGERGNAVFFGHSSNNIFNPGKYKFAFVLLRKLESGDLFYLTKDRQRYVYRVYSKKVVNPDEVSVLLSQSKTATASLITCDPPGTSLRRLVVFGEQISPNPADNKASKLKGSQPSPKILPSNSPSLWQRIKSWLSG